MHPIRRTRVRPYTVIAAALGLTGVGIVALTRLPVDVLPTLRVPVAMVATFYPGMGAPDIEQSITYPLERALSQADQVDHIESRSLAGVSLIKVFLQPGADLGAGVSELVSLAYANLDQLPPGTFPPMIVRFDASAVPACRVVLTSDRLDEARLYEVAYYQVRNVLGGLPGVAAPPVYGGKIRQIMVYLDPDRLRAERVTPMNVVRGLASGNLSLPTSRVKVGDLDYRVVTDALATDLAHLANIPIGVHDGVPIPLHAVASIEDGYATPVNMVRVDGRRAVYIPVFRQEGASTLSVVASTRRAVAGLHIPGVKVTVELDQSVRARAAIAALAQEGILGALLAVLATMLFLRNLGAAVPVVSLLPVALFGGAVGLWISGNTLNTMTLAGLALSFGPVLDVGIVVVENTVRLGEKGLPPRRAARKGAAQMRGALVAVTLVACATLLPVLILRGLLRDLLAPLALASIVAQVVGLVGALALVPLLAGRLVRRHGGRRAAGQAARRERFDRIGRGLRLAFLRGVRAAVRRPSLTLLVVLALMVAGVAGAAGIGLDLYPRVDPGFFSVHLEGDAGLRVERTETLAARAERTIQELVAPADLDRVITDVGLPRGASALYSLNDGPEAADIAVALADGHAVGTADYLASLRAVLGRRLPGVRATLGDASPEEAAVDFGAAAPLMVEIGYRDLSTGLAYAHQLAAAIQRVPGAVDVGVVEGVDYPELSITLDREKAALAGVPLADLTKDVITATSSSARIAPSFFVDPASGLSYFIGVQYREERMGSFDDLLDMPVAFPDGRPVPLRDLVNVRRSSGPVEIAHDRLQRVLHVRVDRDAVTDLGSLSRGVEKAIASAPPPDGLTVTATGEVSRMRDSLADLGVGLLLGVVAIYLTLLALLRSASSPLLVLIAAPPAVAGALCGLHWTGGTVNVQSLVGAVMLLGIATSNSVLLVDAARRGLARGLPARVAAMRAAALRVRPVIMTTCATLLAMLPLALPQGHGHEASAPLARVVIFGLLLSTPLTLIAVPGAVTLLARKRIRP